MFKKITLINNNSTIKKACLPCCCSIKKSCPPVEWKNIPITYTAMVLPYSHAYFRLVANYDSEKYSITNLYMTNKHAKIV